MPKKLSEIEKREIVDAFTKGITIDQLVEKYKLTKVTITRHLKKDIDEDKFKNLLKKNNKFKKQKINIKNDSNTNNTSENEQKNQISSLYDESFIEIAPLNCQIENAPQKDLSSIPISEIELPKIVYMIVDNQIELETKLLKDYPDWQFLSQNELSRRTIEIHFDIKTARRICNKEQKVIKVPNTDVFRITAPFLLSKGITRIVCPDKLISL